MRIYENVTFNSRHFLSCIVAFIQRISCIFDALGIDDTETCFLIPPLPKMIKSTCGIINAIVMKVDNGRAEGMSGKMQRLKGRACGYRNRERFKAAIDFHCGGLDLYPRGVNR